MVIYVDDRSGPDLFFRMKKLSSYRSSSELAFADHFGILPVALPASLNGWFHSQRVLS